MKPGSHKADCYREKQQNTTIDQDETLSLSALQCSLPRLAGLCSDVHPSTKQQLVFMENVHRLAAAYRSATHGPPTGHTCSNSCPLPAASMGGIKNRRIS